MNSFDIVWPWAALLLLGAMHGLNPGMGWLFAVALGLQEDRAAAVWRALPPLALGHAAAVAIFVLAAGALDALLPLPVVKSVAAVALLGFGVFKLFYRKHPRYGGMQVGQLQLTIWSFLMAGAHGAGLMVLPFVLKEPPASAAHSAHMIHAGATLPELSALSSTLIHTGSYLFVTGAIALLVYRKLGLRFLRNAWINLDVIWALALIGTAVLTIAV
jgi:hypothetical protein